MVPGACDSPKAMYTGMPAFSNLFVFVSHDLVSHYRDRDRFIRPIPIPIPDRSLLTAVCSLGPRCLYHSERVAAGAAARLPLAACS